MSNRANRIIYALAVIFLLLSATLRLWDLPTLPPGLTDNEIDDIQITEAARQGNPRVFFNLRGEGREGMYHILLASATSLTGGGLVGYRMLSVFAGMLSLAMVYAVGKRLFGSSAGLTSLAMLAIGMFPVLLSRGIWREALVPLYVSGVLLALARAFPVYGTASQREARTIPFAGLGVALGFGFYIHPISLVVALAVMIFIAYMVLSRQPLSRRTLSYTWFAVVVMIVLATPYLIATLGAPELSGAQRLFIDQEVPDNLTPLQSLIAGLSGIAFRGDTNPTHNLPQRPLIDLVSALLLLVGIAAAVRYWRQPRFALLVICTIIVLPVALLANNSPNFLAMAGALPLIALLFGLGATTLYRSFPSRSRILIALLIVGLLIFNLQWTIRDFFQTWREDEATHTAFNARLGALAHYVDVTAATSDTVVCSPSAVAIGTGEPAPAGITQTQRLLLMMHRQTAPLRYADCGSGLIFTNGGGATQIIAPDEMTLANINPFLRVWYDAGETLSRPDLPPDGVVIMNVERQLADTIGRLTTTAPLSFAPEAPGGQEVTAPPIRMGGNISFLGYEQTGDGVYAPGDTVPIVTYWRVDGDVPSDLRLFVHVLSDPSAIALQWDGISVLPSQLQARDVFVQVAFLQLPFEILDGVYGLSVGAYEDNTDIRLPVYDSNNIERGARLFMGQITVESASAAPSGSD